VNYTIINPTDESLVQTVEHLDLEATDAAISRAALAQRAWAPVAPADKARALRRFAAAVDADIENLAQTEMRNSGHPIAQARWEAGHVRDVLDYYSASPERLFGKQIPVAGGLDVTFNEPLGVVGVITPWNFPMTIAAWGFAPALAAGNAVVLKPAEWTPLTSIRLAELALESGLPEGLFQVLPGRGSVVGERFVTNPTVRKIVFTGSTVVGKRIMAGCAEQVKRVTLELGGKSANIIFPDADIEAAIAGSTDGIFNNAGQACAAGSRLYVHDDVYDEVIAGMAEKARQIKVGNGFDPSTEIGPLASLEHFERVSGYLDIGKGEGEVVTGGARVGDKGYFIEPTIFAGAAPDARIVKEEIFGPVVVANRFKDVDEVVALANDSRYGLSSGIWTKNVATAHSVAARIQAGNVWVNTYGVFDASMPFGGVKESGWGREMGHAVMHDYTDIKTVCVRIDG
jgi:acyl-CoA reductase-like NAD-dependent aldehyde dehydrogenase